jgi:hypothetical protein
VTSLSDPPRPGRLDRHFGLLIVLAVAVAALIGLVTWRLLSKQRAWLTVWAACMHDCRGCDVRCRDEAARRVGSLWIPW